MKYGHLIALYWAVECHGCIAWNSLRESQEIKLEMNSTVKVKDIIE
jgi:hypothetical protein